MTGDLNREILVGRDWANGTFKDKIFRFSSYTFPACKSCNDEFGILERETKPVLIDVMSGNNVEERDLNTLLDWFDKIRTGLWLSDYVLNKNHNGINPHYFISDRVARSDRALIIYKNDKDPDGVNFIGTDGPIFQTMPSVFGLKINNFYFISISAPLLVHKELGLSYPKLHEIDSETEISWYSFSDGTQKIAIPSFINRFPENGITLLQAIKLKDDKLTEGSGLLYDSEHDRRIFNFDNENRRSIFISGKDITKYPKESTRLTIKDVNYPVMFNLQLGLHLMECQEDMFKTNIIYDNITGGKSEKVKNHLDYITNAHGVLKGVYKIQLRHLFSGVLKDLTMRIK
ncbi:hypothetical protein [Photobacterium profundum]|uniref:Uncharacterized protein n=1 Tax=Photobacterium profundum (strain SS9) TaxID=298386 RepID=Q6LW76_PHOPR|nr:hypothetical protein [Photobacterium profundum]CAG17996.1 hypothetical protein PBPRC0058 [Photobacterium profundum SS9]